MIYVYQNVLVIAVVLYKIVWRIIRNNSTCL